MLNKWHFIYDVIDRSVALQIHGGALKDSEDPIIDYFDSLSDNEVHMTYQVFATAYHLYLIDVKNI
jgi:hypothetical protein